MVHLRGKIENMDFLENIIDILLRALKHAHVARMDLQLTNNSSAQFGSNFQTTDFHLDFRVNEDESGKSKIWVLFRM